MILVNVWNEDVFFVTIYLYIFSTFGTWIGRIWETVIMYQGQLICWQHAAWRMTMSGDLALHNVICNKREDLCRQWAGMRCVCALCVWKNKKTRPKSMYVMCVCLWKWQIYIHKPQTEFALHLFNSFMLPQSVCN